MSSKSSSLLKGKIRNSQFFNPPNRDGFYVEDLKSAVAGLIQFHEDRIEELIKVIKENFSKPTDEYDEGYRFYDDLPIFKSYLRRIDREYESIMAIKHWLEDVI
jgi:hypothetical protein